MPKSLRILLLFVSVGVVLTAFLGANSSRVVAATDPDDSGAYRQMQVYSEVLRHIQSDYVVDPNMTNVTNGALRGLAETLDSNSSYLTPAEYKAYKDTKRPKAQVGLSVAKRYGYAMVVSVVPDSPADKAGLNDGDIIEDIDGLNTRDLSIVTISTRLQGEPGSNVSLTMVQPRKPNPTKVTLTRTNIVEPGLYDSLYENASILYLRPAILDKEHVNQVEQKIKNMGRTNSRKILLDLRDVSEGDRDEALRLANLFIKNGTLATLEGQKFTKQTFSADPAKTINATAPMETLINRGTAGPAELVAGALQDNKRSELVGEKSFGDGSQQKTFELPDGAALVLSVAKYQTPSGKKVQDEGITPGVQVASTSDVDDLDDDDGGTTTTVKQTPKKGDLKGDDQLTKALDLLKAKPA